MLTAPGTIEVWDARWDGRYLSSNSWNKVSLSDDVISSSCKDCTKVRIWVYLGLELGLNTKLQFEPQFTIETLNIPN